MNVYRTRQHRRPLLVGVTDADAKSAETAGFATDVFLHPGGAQELAIYLRNGEDPSQLPGWSVVAGEPAAEK
jgi:hypothetical protein